MTLEHVVESEILGHIEGKAKDRAEGIRLYREVPRNALQKVASEFEWVIWLYYLADGATWVLAIPGKYLVLVTQASMNFVGPAPDIGIARLVRLDFRLENSESIVIAASTRRNCKLAIRNGSVIRQYQMFIPQMKPVLKPLGYNVLLCTGWLCTKKACGLSDRGGFVESY